MIESSLFLKGMIIGFSLAAPVGPIDFLCIRPTLAESRVIGLSIGLGAAMAAARAGDCPARADELPAESQSEYL